MATARVDDMLYTLDDNIGVVLHDSELLSLLSANDPLNGGWKGLASRLNYSYDDLCKFERETDPCRAVLEDWRKKHGSTIRVFERALQQLNRVDVTSRLHDLMKGEFELVGVLWRDGRSEEILVDVYGKMTLEEAFETKLLDKDLSVNDLELVHADQTPRFDIPWDSPAYKQKCQQVTFRTKTNTVALRPAEKPSRLRKIASDIDPLVMTPPKLQQWCSGYYPSGSTWTKPAIRGRPLPPDPTSPDPVTFHLPTDSSDDEYDEPFYENINPSPEVVSSSEVCPDNAWSPSEVVSGGNPAAASDWTSVRGWHPLGDKGTNKKVIRDVLRDHLHKDGCYILTPHKRTGDAVLSVTYKNATKSFLVHRLEQTTKQPTLYFLYQQQFCAYSAEELMAYYKRHKLTYTVPVKLKHPIPFNGH